MPKPLSSEYPAYYERYISKIQETDIISFLKKQHDDFLHLIQSIPEEKTMYAYAPGKWTVKELLCHVIDAERIFAYRALTFARKDPNKLPGFEEDDYAKNSFANERTMQSLAEEFSHLRLSNMVMFSSFSNEILKQKGIANNNEVSVNAIQYIMAGHVLHHTAILNERYL
jgi:uncharacterized damage-inducible protein DinB